MNKYDFKNIIKRIIVGVAIAFLIMSIKQCKVFALVSKGSFYQSFDNVNSMSGTLSTGSNEITQRFTFNTPITLNGSDYVLFRFSNFDFTYQWDYQNDYYACQNYNISHGYVQNQFVDTSMTCSQWQYNDSNRMVEGTLNISGLVRDTSTDHGGACYISDEMKGFLICNLKNTYMTDLKYLDLTISQSGYNSVRYNVGFFGLKYWYNNDSTEIINGLTGVQQKQQQVVDSITDTNISGANTSTNNALSGIDSDVTDTLDNSISPNQLNTILTNFTNQLSTSTCTPITLPIPYTNENIVLPCLGTEFSQRIPVIWALYELIITGVIVLRFWQHGVEFVLNVLDPYHIGANNVPTGGGK